MGLNLVTNQTNLPALRSEFKRLYPLKRSRRVLIAPLVAARARRCRAYLVARFRHGWNLRAASRVSGLFLRRGASLGKKRAAVRLWLDRSARRMLIRGARLQGASCDKPKNIKR